MIQNPNPYRIGLIAARADLRMRVAGMKSRIPLRVIRERCGLKATKASDMLAEIQAKINDYAV
jgi:hypothetical protein